MSDTSQGQRLVPGPPGPSPEWRRVIEERVHSDVDSYNRQNLWSKARENCIKGKYSQADFYLLKHFLLGDNGSFSGRDGKKRHVAVWDM
eukprot:1509197-Karenia_brevis.AAC.1